MSWGAAAKVEKRRRAMLAAAAAIALLVFATDLLTPLQGAVAVLYVVSILLVAHCSSARASLGAGMVCAVLAIVAFMDDHMADPLGASHVRLAVSLVAIAATTLLSVEQRRAVAERDEARARIDRTSAELAHASRVSTLGQLAASIAHEVNQPLAAIVTCAESGKRWLAREVPDVAEAEGCLDQIGANGKRAAGVISRVRALASNSAPETVPLALAELVGEAVAMVEREARDAGVAIRRTSDAAVPPVLGDRIQIQQVLVNLLMNGIQAMRDVEGRGRELCIHMGVEADGMVRVAVSDCGEGIKGDPARIFDPFFTTKADGMGMGLAISRSIVEAQDGRVSAANNPLHGATIAFTLPAHN